MSEARTENRRVALDILPDGQVTWTFGRDRYRARWRDGRRSGPWFLLEGAGGKSQKELDRITKAVVG